MYIHIFVNIYMSVYVYTHIHIYMCISPLPLRTQAPLLAARPNTPMVQRLVAHRLWF